MITLKTDFLLLTHFSEHSLWRVADKYQEGGLIAFR